MTTFLLTVAVVLVFLGIIALGGVRIAWEYERGVIFRLGRHVGLRGPGIYWIIPLVEWQRRVDLRINTAAVEQQETHQGQRADQGECGRLVPDRQSHGVGPGSQEHRHRRDSSGPHHVAHRHRPAFAR